MSGPAVKSHTWPNKGRRFSARWKISYLLLSWIVLKFWYQLVFSSSLPQDSSSTSSSPATERSDDRAPGNWRHSPKTQNKNKKRDNDGATGNRLRDFLEWSEEFTENLEDTEVLACTRTHFSRLRFRTASQEAQHFYSLPERSELLSMLANQNDKGSLQKTHWRSSTSSRKVWWLDNSRSKCSMTKVATEWIQSEFKRVSRAVGKAESHLHWQFIGIWQILWRRIMESHCTSTHHRSETNGIVERAVRRIKIRLRRKMVGWLYGMLLLSSKCSRPPGRLRNSFATGDSKNHLKAQWFLLEQWLNIIRFLHETSQGSIKARKFYLEYSSNMH